MSASPRVLQMPRATQGMRAFMFYIDDWRSSWAVEAMDDHEKVAYLNLLMKAASEPDCGLPDNDLELAVISGLGLRWFKPTRDRNKRIGYVTDDGVTVFKSAGEKLRECFSFRPKTEQAPDGRLYNERLHREYVHKEELRTKNRRDTNTRTVGETPPPIDVQSNLGYTQGEPAIIDPPPPTLQPTTNTREVPPPPNSESGPVVGGEPPPKEITLGISDQEYLTFSAHCQNPPQPLGTPSPALTRRLKERFYPIRLDQLPKFPSQRSPGYWDTVSKQQVLMEIESQRIMRENPQLFRKPTDRELANQELMRRAHERDKAAGRV